ncbi:GNAT family N-acetyltransferase [Phormidesmis sp. 146-35]
MSLQLSFQSLLIGTERELLADWLSSDRWMYHGDPQLSREKVLEWVDQGEFTGTNCQTFWIVANSDQRVGLIRLFDLDDIDDGSPMFDLRIQSEYRGQGIGKRALQWLTAYLFETWSELERIEGSTCVDNLAMRKVFLQCNYVKEGHFRKAWVTVDGKRLDSICYGILREDWINQTITPINWNDEM